MSLGYKIKKRLLDIRTTKTQLGKERFDFSYNKAIIILFPHLAKGNLMYVGKMQGISFCSLLLKALTGTAGPIMRKINLKV